MTGLRIFVPVVCLLAVAGCETSGVSTSSSSQPRSASYKCTSDVTLTVRRAGSGVEATDSRGFAAEMPASPPGQRARFAEGIHALLLEGRNATWFVSGQTPVECRR